MQDGNINEPMTIRLVKGTALRIDAVLYGGEVRSAFVRRAVEAELARREAKVARLEQRRA
jgi:hypothetical protein